MRTTIISEKYEIRDLLQALINQINLTGDISVNNILLLQNYEKEYVFVKKFVKAYFEQNGTKKCTCCKEYKPSTTDFYRKNTQRSNGLRDKCKICESIYDVEIRRRKGVSPRSTVILHSRVPKCKLCEYLKTYRMVEGSKEHYRCNLIQSLNLLDKNIPASKMKTSPKWCPMRSDRKGE